MTKEPVEADQKNKWYFSHATVVVALMVAGPLALPLLWMSPRYSVTVKIIISVAVIAVSVWAYFTLEKLYSELSGQLEALGLK
jgi:hypothetical protein